MNLAILLVHFEAHEDHLLFLHAPDSPTRITLVVKDLPLQIKTGVKEIKGPRVDSSDQIIQGFIKAKNISQKDLIEKDTKKGKFYFIKTQSQFILVEDLLNKIIPRAIL